MAIPMTPEMPMGQAAQLPLDTSSILGALPSKSPAAGAPPPAAAGMMGQAGAMSFPEPGAPAEPPFDVRLQPDGSSVYVTKTQPEIVIGINPAPKLPKALQPPTK